MTTKKYHHGDLKNALINASIEILSKDGIGGLSLRKVAQKAGVSHAAPYAHFVDKQALIAAISTEGYRMLYEQFNGIFEKYPNDPKRQLVEAAWVYVGFAQSEPAQFRVTFSSAVEREKDYPALVEMTRKTFKQVTQIVEGCQAVGLLHTGPVDLQAVSVWSLVHGLASLLIESLISHSTLEYISLRDILIFTLNQITLEYLDPNEFPELT